MNCKANLCGLLSFFIATLAWSKPQLNSMCYMEDRPSPQVEGTNSNRRLEIASLSKIFTSYWALSRLGPQYRFKTHVYITPVSDNTVDVHLAGGRDPFFGREMTFFLVSELVRLNIHSVRALTFDENFVFNWNVRENPIPSFAPQADKIASALRQRLRFSARQYTAVLRDAQGFGVTMVAAPRLNISHFQFLSKRDFSPAIDSKAFELRSVPLHRYLKEMNRNSNNHVADRLFEFLGGTANFQTFLEGQGYQARDIRFVNGSGDSVKVPTAEGKIVKVYNEATCSALVHTLDSMRGVLKTSGMDLQNIMSVSGVDTRSTLKGRYSAAAVSGAMVAKTGTVDPAVALAGMISTDKGDIYFGILYQTNGPGDWNRGRDAIRNQVVGLMAKFGGKDLINGYHSSGFLPFDSSSKLMKVSDGAPERSTALN